MNKMKVFKYIKADRFFPAYLPEIKNYKRKISGRNGRGNPVDFTDQELKQIKKALKRLFADLSK
jgi:hypothetical protein